MLLVILHISAAGVILLITDALTVGGVVAVTFLIAAVPLLQAALAGSEAQQAHLRRQLEQQATERQQLQEQQATRWG